MEVVQGFEKICKIATTEEQKLRIEKLKADIKNSSSENLHQGIQINIVRMDKTEKLKSIHGVTIVWIEECSELKYEGFKELLGKARHPDLYRIAREGRFGTNGIKFFHSLKLDLMKL